MKKLIISILFITLCYACSTSKEQINKIAQNQSHYHLMRFERSQSADSAIVVINAQEIGSKTMLPSYTIKVNDQDVFHIDNDTTGIIALESGNYSFHFLSLGGLHAIQTKTYKIDKKDSLRINFYSKFKPIE